MNGASEERLIAYENARLLDPASGYDGPGALIVAGGRISDMGPDAVPPRGAERVDCGGLALCPGLVDMRVFTGEPGAEHKETFATVSAAAVAGGVTTLIVMPDTDPAIDDAAILEFVSRRARASAQVNILPMAALTKGVAGAEMTEIGLLQAAGAVGFTDGRRAIADAGLMRRLLAYASTFDALIAPYAEDASLASGVMNESEMSARLGLPGTPAAAETLTLERDLTLAGMEGARYHASQITCAASLNAVAAARAAGVDVTCAASINHLVLNELDVGDYRTFLRMNPPLRGEADRLALVEGLASGALDIIVSSHDPQPPENKRLPFAEATPGAAGVETLLAAALTLHHEGAVPLLGLLAALTCNPARRLGLEAGRLAPGAPADFALIDLDAPFVVKPSELSSQSQNTPFEGRLMQGRVMRTICGGETIFERRPA